MFGKLVHRLAVVLLLLSFSFSAAHAQPMLPDMIGASQNGINLITWTCQYNGVKSIAVQRSSDSSYNYTTIGYVKVLAKGQQAFLDGHAKAGNNWYRLCIVFGSDLTWYSNSLRLKLDSSWVLKQKAMPSNDSLQKFASSIKITESPADGQPKAAAPASQAPPSVTITTAAGVRPNTQGAGVKPIAAASNTGSVPPPNSTALTNGQKNTSLKPVLDTALHKKDSVRRIAVANTNTLPVQQVQQPTQPKITMPKIVTETDPSLYIKSQYVFTNPYTGHVHVEIPNAKNNLYSLKFYDSKNHMLFEVPRVIEPVIIIDKRNFQHKGSYKFELYRDRAKMEAGFISIY